jgi:hypothetical protein
LRAAAVVFPGRVTNWDSSIGAVMMGFGPAMPVGAGVPAKDAREQRATEHRTRMDAQQRIVRTSEKEPAKISFRESAVRNRAERTAGRAIR